MKEVKEVAVQVLGAEHSTTKPVHAKALKWEFWPIQEANVAGVERVREVTKSCSEWRQMNGPLQELWLFLGMRLGTMTRF